MSTSKAARKSFFSSRYYLFEEFKLLAARCRWLGFRARLSLRGDLSRRYWFVRFYALRGPELQAFFVQAKEQLLQSLRRAPTWSEGHLMIASVEARMLENATAPDLRSLRAIEIEAEAFLMLQSPEKERREIGIAHTLRAWVKQVRGDFQGAFQEFERVLALPSRSGPAGGERAAILEAAARLAIILDNPDRGREMLLQIPEQFKTNDVVALLNQSSAD